MSQDKTSLFEVKTIDTELTRDILHEVYEALKERGYNPTNQIVGYLMSDDPGYISNHKDARKKLTKIDRTRILEVIIRKITN